MSSLKMLFFFFYLFFPLFKRLWIEIKALNNILKILLISIKTLFYIPRSFAVVIRTFKFKKFSLTIADIESAFRYI